MLSGNLMNISMQHIYVFLRAAKYENFTKVANELHMTQSTVSRNIETLENELGLILFIRDKQRVKLTPGGRLLHEEWNKAVDLIENALEKTYITQQGNCKQLCIGDYNTTPCEFYLLPIIKYFENKNKNVKLSIERVDPSALIEGITDAKYDLVFFSTSGKKVFDDLKMEYIPILDLIPCVVLSKNHPLYYNNVISKEELSKLTFLTFVATQRSYEKYWDCSKKIFEECGFMPANIKFVDNPHSMTIELELGECAALMDHAFQPCNREHLRYIELNKSKTRFGFILAYSPTNTNPYVKKFVDAAKEFQKSNNAQNALCM